MGAACSSSSPNAEAPRGGPASLLPPLPALGENYDEASLRAREQALLAQLAEVLRLRAKLRAGASAAPPKALTAAFASGAPEGAPSPPASPLRPDHPALGGAAALVLLAERRARWFADGGGGGGGDGEDAAPPAAGGEPATSRGGSSVSAGDGGGGGGGGAPPSAALPVAPAGPPQGSPAWQEAHRAEVLALGAKLNGDWLLDEANSDGVQPLMVGLGCPPWIAKLLLAGSPPPLSFELNLEHLNYQFKSKILSQVHVNTWAGPNFHKTPDGGKHSSELLLQPAEAAGGLCKVCILVHFTGRGDLFSTHAFGEPNKHLLKLQLFKDGKLEVELNRIFLPKPPKHKKK